MFVAAILTVIAFSLDSASDPYGFDDINFVTGSTVVKDAPKTIDRLAQTLRANPNWRVELVGFADPRTGSVPNVELSMTRARSVKLDLLARGVPEDAIRCLAGGVLCESSEDRENWFTQRCVKVRLIRDGSDEKNEPPRRVDPCGENGARIDGILDDPNVLAVIATMPDPVESFLGRELDHYLTSIRRAFEARSFRLVDHHLVWDRDAESPQHLSCPGYLLFRRSRSEETKDPVMEFKSDQVMVLVVGESTIRGVARDALWQALTQVGYRPIRVIGPTFSGSAQSLAETLSTFRRNRGGIVQCIVSGTATSTDLPNLFESRELPFYSMATDDGCAARTSAPAASPLEAAQPQLRPALTANRSKPPNKAVNTVTMGPSTSMGASAISWSIPEG